MDTTCHFNTSKKSIAQLSKEVENGQPTATEQQLKTKKHRPGSVVQRKDFMTYRKITTTSEKFFLHSHLILNITNSVFLGFSLEELLRSCLVSAGTVIMHHKSVAMKVRITQEDSKNHLYYTSPFLTEIVSVNSLRLKENSIHMESRDT